MAIKNVVSALNELDTVVVALTAITTSTRISPYVKEGVRMQSKNLNLGDSAYDFRVAVDYSGGNIVQGGVSFYMYYADNASNWQHNVFTITAPDGTIMLRLYKAINSVTHTWYYSSTTGTEASTGASVPVDGLHRWDILWKIAADGTGYFQVYIDGVLNFSVSGQNNGRGSSIGYFTGRSENGSSIDRVYSGIICADEDTRDMRVVQQVPTGTGALNEWTGSYLDVDETSSDSSDTLNVATTGKISLMTFPAIPAGPASDTNVIGVFLRSAGWGNTDGIDVEVRSGGTNYNVGETIAASVTTKKAIKEILTDPNTTTAWTIAGIDAAQFGYAT